MTTVLCIRNKEKVVIAGDGQVTLGNTVMKGNAKKIRRMYKNQVLAGFAGSTADAFTLFSKFEDQLEAYKGNLLRAASALAQEWRTDKMLRRLEALLIVADANYSFIISGTGDVIEPEDSILAIGSGGSYALAATRALIRNSSLPISQIAKEAMEIAGEICIYTNENIIFEEIEIPQEAK